MWLKICSSTAALQPDSELHLTLFTHLNCIDIFNRIQVLFRLGWKQAWVGHILRWLVILVFAMNISWSVILYIEGVLLSKTMKQTFPKKNTIAFSCCFHQSESKESQALLRTQWIHTHARTHARTHTHTHTHTVSPWIFKSGRKGDSGRETGSY